MKQKRFVWLGVGLMMAIGVIHLLHAPEEYDEAAYMGQLFVANFLGAVVASAGIRRRARWGWLLGLLIAAGSIVAYILSRSAGMPGMEREPWLLPSGVLALVLEALFVALAFAAWPAPQVGYRRPAAVVLGVGLAGLGAFFLLTLTVPISTEALAEEYGVQVTMVGTSLLGDIIDVRLRILDAAKAEALFSDHDATPYLLVDGGGPALMAPTHSGHQRELLPGRTYNLFYPNPRQVVRPGSSVSLVFTNRRLDPMTVR